MNSRPGCCATGIDHSGISRRLFDTAPFGWLGLLSAVTGRAVLEPDVGDGGLVWTWSSTAEAAEHGLPGEQLEALVDVVRSTEEADVACVLKGQDDGSWSVSLRSRGAHRLWPGSRWPWAAAATALAAGYSSYLDREDDRSQALRASSVAASDRRAAPRSCSRSRRPALVVLAAEPLYLLVDTAVVGHLGAVALGGLAVGGGLLAWAAALLNFLAYGTTARAARRAGAGDRAGAVAEGVQATWLALVLGLVVLVLFQLARRPADPAARRWRRTGRRRRASSGCGSPPSARRCCWSRWPATAGCAACRSCGSRCATCSPAAWSAWCSARCWCIPVGLGLAGSAIANLAGQRSTAALFVRALAREDVSWRPRPGGASAPSWSSAATCCCAPRCSSCRSSSPPASRPRGHRRARRASDRAPAVLLPRARARRLRDRRPDPGRPRPGRRPARRGPRHRPPGRPLGARHRAASSAAACSLLRGVLLPLFTDDPAVLGQAERGLVVPRRRCSRWPASSSPWTAC